MIRPGEAPWDEREEALRQEFRDKIIPICDEYSELIGEHAVLSEFFGAIVAYLITNDFVRDAAAAKSFGSMFANALRAALDVGIDLSEIALMQSGDFNA
tara:strand:- start:430 stop:726 length:297 start_codon:yes stop_codon:yes gene_type:complete